MSERRITERQPLDLYFNKFLHGYPYLCRAVDLSIGGILVETFAEPDLRLERFPLELRLPDDSEACWVWARPVRREGTRQAMQFVSLSKPVRAKLERYLGSTHPRTSAPH